MQLRRRYAFALFVIGSVTLVALFAPAARAGKVFQLDYEWEGPVPVLPAGIVVNVYEGSTADPGKLRGTSSLDFDGANNTNVFCDSVACITAVKIEGGKLRVNFTTLGHRRGTFKANTGFEVVVNGAASFLPLHTSCSQVIPLNTPLAGDPDGIFVIADGQATCLPPQLGCPEGTKLFSLNGEFRLPLDACTLGSIVYNVYRKENDLVGTSTATFVGGGLTNIVCDDIACLTDAFVDGDELVIVFETDGYRGVDEQFAKETSFEMDLGSCGTHRLIRLHTSCSRAIVLFSGYGAGGGSFVFTSGCGICVVTEPLPTEAKSWGAIKKLYE